MAESAARHETTSLRSPGRAARSADTGGWLAPSRAGGGRGVALDLARGLAAAAVLLSAAVHADLWDLEGFRQVHVIGGLFLLNAIGGLVIALAVLVWRHWLPALICAGFGALTLAAFWLAVEVGLFGFRESATGSAQYTAEAAEIAAIVFGLTAVAIVVAAARRGFGTEKVQR